MALRRGPGCTRGARRRELRSTPAVGRQDAGAAAVMAAGERWEPLCPTRRTTGRRTAWTEALMCQGAIPAVKEVTYGARPDNSMANMVF